MLRPGARPENGGGGGVKTNEGFNMFSSVSASLLGIGEILSVSG